jgi:regulator of protease activity HflC (stomatin/prohibitin superfamily)
MTQEKRIKPLSGWAMLAVAIIWIIAAGLAIAFGATTNVPILLMAGIVAIPIFAVFTAGFLVLQPGQAGVLLMFGSYVGTVTDPGLWWVNPFTTKKRISLRLRNMNGSKLKVNDKAGNPIEIAAVVVWKVEDTFAACFEVDDYQDFVNVQGEAALRHLASLYPYDSWEENDANTISLRGNIDQVSEALEKELQERLQKAGVLVSEARLSHLAYASEIAEAMLRRQQAGAIVAARKTLVEGAVGMVRMALEQIRSQNVVEMDDERKAAMVSNLLVVLCGESNAQPIVNAGTLYH